MATSREEYSKMAQYATPNSRKVPNFFKAFFVGGFICMIGQALFELYRNAGMDENSARILVSVSLVACSAILTAAGVYDKVAKFAGAGILVPITGFANAVVAPAMDYRPEGKILGTGAQIFSIAGPVIVYGVASSVVYGFVIWLFGLI